MRTQWIVGERGYKYAVVNNAEVDKPHHVTLQKQKGWDGSWAARGGESDWMCAAVPSLQMKGAGKKTYMCVKRWVWGGGGRPLQWKGLPNSSNFQNNQRGPSWTLIALSVGYERSPKGSEGQKSLTLITCPSALTYPCWVSRGVRQLLISLCFVKMGVKLYLLKRDAA